MCVEQGNLIVGSTVNPPYDVELTQYEEQMRSGRVTAETVRSRHVLKYRILEQASFEMEQTLAFSSYLTLEKGWSEGNSRLILEQVWIISSRLTNKKRMRPIHGQ